MSNHFKPMLIKKADDDAEVTIYRDLHHGWFVGKKGDQAFDPIPLGAFRSQKAAQGWADHRFAGGQWKPAD